MEVDNGSRALYPFGDLLGLEILDASRRVDQTRTVQIEVAAA